MIKRSMVLILHVYRWVYILFKASERTLILLVKTSLGPIIKYLMKKNSNYSILVNQMTLRVNMIWKILNS